jgi:hypothetical protein
MAKEITFVQEEGDEDYAYTIRVNGRYAGKLWHDGKAILRPMSAVTTTVFDNVCGKSPKRGTMVHLFKALQKM